MICGFHKAQQTDVLATTAMGLKIACSAGAFMGVLHRGQCGGKETGPPSMARGICRLHRSLDSPSCFGLYFSIHSSRLKTLGMRKK
jgi:hypothetical protein